MPLSDLFTCDLSDHENLKNYVTCNLKYVNNILTTRYPNSYGREARCQIYGVFGNRSGLFHVFEFSAFLNLNILPRTAAFLVFSKMFEPIAWDRKGKWRRLTAASHILIFQNRPLYTVENNAYQTKYGY